MLIHKLYSRFWIRFSKQSRTRVIKYRRFIERGCSIIIMVATKTNTLNSLFYTHSCHMPRMQRQTCNFWINLSHEELQLHKMLNVTSLQESVSVPKSSFNLHSNTLFCVIYTIFENLVFGRRIISKE